jgi:hypothetical protein
MSRFRGEDIDVDPDEVEAEAPEPPQPAAAPPAAAPPDAGQRTRFLPTDLASVDPKLICFGTFDPGYKPKPAVVRSAAGPAGSRYAPRRRLYAGPSVTVEPTT